MATTFSVGKGDYIRPFRNVEVRHFPEDASQSFKRGEVLILGGAGVENKVKIAADDAVANIVGIAAEDASGVTGNKVAVYLAKPEAEFIARTLSTDPVDFSDIGAGRALVKDATNVIWVVDTSDASHDAVIPIQYRDPGTKEIQTAEGDSSALCVFRFAFGATIWAATV